MNRRGLKLWSALVALLCCVVLIVTGCSSIPMDGEIGRSEGGPAPIETPNEEPPPAGPAENDIGQKIVEGFLDAGRGNNDDYSVAREYLTGAAVSAWRPDERTVVYRDSPSFENLDDDKLIRVTLNTVGTVDDRGIYTAAAADEKLTFDINIETDEDGQNRISQVPNGVALRDGVFRDMYGAYEVYFYDPTFTYLVPDVRWFATNQPVATSLVRVTLDGPAEYLKGAVTSAFPADTSLDDPAVLISGDRAEVDLPQRLIEKTDQAGQIRMLRQLTATLVDEDEPGGLTGVDLQVNRQSLEMEDTEGQEPPPSKNPKVSTSQVAIQENNLVMLTEEHIVQPIEGLASTAADRPTDPAMSYDLTRFAYLSPDGTRLSSRSDDGRGGTVFTGSKLTRPSFDRFNWLWTADASGRGLLLAFRDGEANTSPNFEPKEVGADWLQGNTITSLQISRDGARALIITTDQESKATITWVAGIRRSATGVPQELAKPLKITAADSNVNAAVWISETQFVVINESENVIGRPRIIDLGGTVTALAQVSSASSIAGGNGAGQVYVQGAQGLVKTDENQVTPVGTDVTDTAFAG